MEKKSIIISVFIILSIVGIALFQTNVLTNSFISGFGYVLAVLSVVIGIFIGMILK
ncbi:MAG TPA: hypothetical protein PLU96_07985 [Methanofastidiosum sp.]|nr:hypothetical protein [Methanofastidiosum sp.]HQG61999.1 hypothetical protein [Methanofastidiosum sp.]